MTTATNLIMDMINKEGNQKILVESWEDVKGKLLEIREEDKS